MPPPVHDAPEGRLLHVEDGVGVEAEHLVRRDGVEDALVDAFEVEEVAVADLPLVVLGDPPDVVGLVGDGVVQDLDLEPAQCFDAEFLLGVVGLVLGARGRRIPEYATRPDRCGGASTRAATMPHDSGECIIPL